MAYKVKQFRFYGENNPNNYPKNLTVNQLGTGSVFKPYTPITQLGVQYDKANPIKFYINGSDNAILSHPYGLYELDLTGLSQILSLTFDIFDSDGNLLVDEDDPLIIDIVYLEGE